MLTGAGLAMHLHPRAGWILTLSLLTAFLLQILSNLANDYGDSRHGADNKNRLGPERAVQSGRISAAQMQLAIRITGFLALVSGITLLAVAFAPERRWTALLVLLCAGLTAIAAAYRYTAGNKPYGYQGWGDVSVFLFFGCVGVMGSAYLYAGSWLATSLLPACWTGLQSTAVLNLNNLRDHENDRASGKHTMIARMGFRRGVIYHGIIVMTAGLLMLGYTIVHPSLVMWLATACWTLVSVLQTSRLMRVRDYRTIDPELRRTALTTFALALLFLLQHQVWS